MESGRCGVVMKVMKKEDGSIWQSSRRDTIIVTVSSNSVSFSCNGVSEMDRGSIFPFHYRSSLSADHEGPVIRPDTLKPLLQPLICGK